MTPQEQEAAQVLAEREQLVKERAKLMGDWEKIKPIFATDGWLALKGYLAEQSADLKKRMILKLDKVLYSDTPGNRQEYQEIRIQALGMEAALNVDLEFETRVKTALRDIEDEKVLEGEATPSHSGEDIAAQQTQE